MLMSKEKYKGGGRRLEISSCRLQDRIGSRQYAVGKIKLLIANCLLLSLFCFLPTANCQLPTAFADQITIRTIVTPIGSQSEKWGAAGLMVCIVGETIPNGGCGAGVNGGYRIQPGTTTTKEEITGLEDGTIVIFKDTSDGSGAGSNHQYDYDSGFPSDSDTVYEVKDVESWGGESFIIGTCTEFHTGDGCASCSGVRGDAYCNTVVAGWPCAPSVTVCACSTGTRVCYDVVTGFASRCYLCFCLSP